MLVTRVTPPAPKKPAPPAGVAPLITLPRQPLSSGALGALLNVNRFVEPRGVKSCVESKHGMNCAEEFAHDRDNRLERFFTAVNEGVVVSADVGISLDRHERWHVEGGANPLI